MNGQVVNASLEGGIQARVATLFSKLIPVDANVKGAISGTRWSGVAQKDSASVAEANMICRERAFEKLVTLIAEQPKPGATSGVAHQAHPNSKPARQPAPRPSAVLPQPVAPGTPQATIRDARVAARQAASEQDFQTTLNSWLTAARLGDPSAQFEVAQIYDYGAPGVPKDCVEATHWYKAAAAQNLSAANYNVGGEYYYGCKGLFEADHVMALSWLQKAVDEGSPDAEYEIGMIYYNGGAGVERDRALARTWLTRAANHGYPLAEQALRNFSDG